MKEKVILAYSGGLDTSIIIPWLKENYDIDVIAVCANVGQDENMDEVYKKALKSGASKVYVDDISEEFVTETIFKAIKAEAKYEGKYLLGTSLARPIIAKKLVEVAHSENAKYICHGCTGKGNDQVRFEASIAALDPSIKIIAPWRLWNIKSREDAIEYANKNNIPIAVSKEKIYSVDENIWHISTEGGDIEYLENEHQNHIYKKCCSIEDASDEAEYVEIYFEKGIPKMVNGLKLLPVDIIKTLNNIGAKHGIGVIDIVENRLVGMKSRGIYETPGGTILYEAHNILESATLDKETLHFKQLVSLKYGELIYNGLWFTKVREAIDAFVETTQDNVCGSVRIKLYKGCLKPAGIFTENALYQQSISSFGESELYNHEDAQGFINLFTLPLKIKAMKANSKIDKCILYDEVAVEKSI
ncbi:MAG: argininosuccinate synthase [Romboutsia sp.]